MKLKEVPEDLVPPEQSKNKESANSTLFLNFIVDKIEFI